MEDEEKDQDQKNEKEDETDGGVHNGELEKIKTTTAQGASMT